MVSLLFFLGCWFIYALVGVAWSRQVFQRGLFGFDLGYLQVAILVSRGVSLRLEGIGLSRRLWIILFLSTLPGFALEGLADHFLSALSYGHGRGDLWGFVVSSTLFLLFNVIWIVVFPFANLADSWSWKEGAWRKTVLWLGVALIGLVVVAPAWVMAQLRNLPSGIQDLLPILEIWFYRLSLLIYLFLTIRVMLPMWETHPFGASGDSRRRPTL